MKYNSADQIKNFTPLLDDLVKNYGIITASVWGRVWRYAQQENGVCQASLDKLANELNLGRRTIIRHIEILCRDGYLFDHTPNLRNKPHTYGISIQAEPVAVPEKHSARKAQCQSDTLTVPESHSHSARESLEDTIKKQIKKQYSDTFPDPLKTPEFEIAWSDWCMYRSEIKHKLTPSTIKRQLKMLSQHPPEVAVAIIDQSIERGWQGLFPLDQKSAKQPQSNNREVIENEDGTLYV